jgi:hypothetical protein
MKTLMKILRMKRRKMKEKVKVKGKGRKEERILWKGKRVSRWFKNLKRK